MRIAIVAVGRLKSGALADAFADYAKRLKSGRVELQLIEVEERRRLAGAELMAREAALLSAAIPRGTRLIALDGRGKPMSSEAFAAQLGRWRDGGDALAFVIGGADGLDASLRDQADMILSLGAMTWPHMLARVMLAEQLYRAQSILSGHPYHRA